MKKLFLFAILFLLTIPGVAQKKPFTIEDLYHLKTVNDPRISPDGSKITFTVTSYFLHKGKHNTEIYLMNADGSQIHQMTNNPAADYAPRWSPDGKSILFISTRKNGAQLWLLPVFGGEPKQLTHISTEISNPVWSSDGRKIMFETRVFPECGAVDSCNKKIDESMKEGPIQAHMADHLLYRHWTSYKDGRRHHIFVFDLDSKKMTDVTPGNYDSPPFSLSGATDYDFSPDGQEICFTSKRVSHPESSTNDDLWLVPLTGGKAKNITADNPAYDGQPRYSPDGRSIAYRTQKIPGYESDLFRLAVYDRKTGKKRIITENFDNWVDDFAWAPDSKSIYFIGEVKGHFPLYNVRLKDQRIRLVADLKTINAFDIAPNGKWVAVSRRAVKNPYEIWRVNTNGQSPRRLTFCNKAVEDSVDIRPVEEMWIPGADGIKVQTFIVKPNNFNPAVKYPLILNVHGGPQGQWADAFRGDWQVYPGAGYIVAFPNPHGSTGFGEAYTEEISKDWGGKVYKDIMDVADSMAKIP